MRVLAACLHPAGPPGDQWHADAAIGQAALDAGEGTSRIKTGDVVFALVVRAVVAGEDDECVFGQPEFIEMFEHAPHIAVESRDHRCLTFVLVWPVLVSVGAVIRHMRAIAEEARALVVRVRDDHAPVEEEGCAFVFADEFQGIIGKEIIRVVNGFGRITGTIFTGRHDDV